MKKSLPMGLQTWGLQTWCLQLDPVETSVAILILKATKRGGTMRPLLHGSPCSPSDGPGLPSFSSSTLERLQPRRTWTHWTGLSLGGQISSPAATQTGTVHTFRNKHHFSVCLHCNYKLICLPVKCLEGSLPLPWCRSQTCSTPYMYYTEDTSDKWLHWCKFPYCSQTHRHRLVTPEKTCFQTRVTFPWQPISVTETETEIFIHDYECES